jgi:allophanate hydrolase subunit 2
MSVYTVLQQGLFKTVGPPVFGRQDRGVSPGGAMDRLAFETGRILLGGLPDVATLEIILPPVIRFDTDCVVVVTGARFDAVRLEGSHGGPGRTVGHAETVEAAAGSRIEFGQKVLGFRAYLGILPARGIPRGQVVSGRRRGEFADRFTWPDRDGRIRVLPGPEHGHLENPGAFTANPWKTTQEMSDMGMRLAGFGPPLRISLENMISAPVSDGTVQLPPQGPIVLLRHRQTVGGYPRVFNVVSADMDLLAQYGPEQILRFREVSMEEAREAARRRRREIDALARRFGAGLRRQTQRQGE